MTRIIRGLEEAGLVHRAADPGDGRVTRVRATARGKRVLQRARERRIAKLAERLSALDSQEIATVREAADLVDAALRLSSAPAEPLPRGVGSADSRA
jgi:DNA-binding MarR family transcriptional regulator